MQKHVFSSHGIDCGGTRIRDQVHGDILLPEKFMAIVDSIEFQRLRYVKQLATAQYTFPGATHTRFEHSIGTFHVMQQILNHFERYFTTLGQPELIDQDEKDLLLAASLLHDLGHTPFSHALEDAMPNAKKIPHEKWTVDIIMYEGGQLNSVLKQYFGEKAPDIISKLILLQHDDEKDPFFSASEIKLESIFHSLISSQLDADRLDYIRRDSLATGFSYGLIDIDRLISGFRIGILNNGKAVVCVAEEYLPDVERYLYARYQMYRNVYLKPYKMLTEELLRKIIRIVYDLYDHDKLKISDLPVGFKAALQKATMSNDDFLSLDDYVILGAVKGWAKLSGEQTEVLSGLCQCLLERKGFQKYEFADVSAPTMKTFKKELVTLLNGYMRKEAIKFQNPTSDDESIAEFPFLVLKAEYPQLYKNNKDNIFILEESGRLVEISDCSKLVRAFLQDPDIQEGADGAVTAIYFSRYMLECYLRQRTLFHNLTDDTIKQIVDEVEMMFRRREARNTIEIEKKYSINLNELKLDWKKMQQELCNFLSDQYVVALEGAAIGNQQTDYYFDTPDEKLYKNHYSLRIRSKDGNFEITCKRPVEGSYSCGGYGQMERYEYARTIQGITEKDIFKAFQDECNISFFEQHVDGIALAKELEQVIIVENLRTKYIVRAKHSQQIDEVYELVFDYVKYINRRTDKEYVEYQIELELKSDPVTRLNMQILTNKLENKFIEWKLSPITNSKYERARNFTK